MPDSLLDLEKRRSEVFAEISLLLAGRFSAWFDFGNWRSMRYPNLPWS